MIGLYALKPHVIVSGGCFQNSILLTRVCEHLKENNIKVIIPKCVPLNDACIATGQLYYTALNL